MTFGGDILDDFDKQRRQPQYRAVPATPGLLVEDRSSGFCGDVVKTDARAVTLRDRNGRDREFVYKPGGFLIDGKPVTLVRPPARVADAGPRVTASGSIAAPSPQRARRAAASRSRSGRARPAGPSRRRPPGRSASVPAAAGARDDPS